MRKDDLVYELRSKLCRDGFYISYIAVETAVDELFSIISSSLERGEGVTVQGFGSFKPVERAERIGRNPRENTPVIIPKRTMPVFTPSDKLKRRVSGVGGANT